jgi:hypothetical protein
VVNTGHNHWRKNSTPPRLVARPRKPFLSQRVPKQWRTVSRSHVPTPAVQV